MNEQEFLTKLTQFRQPPPRDFADNLYRRISQPMVNQPSFPVLALRRTAVAIAFAAVALIVTLSISPAARAFTGEQLRQIGAILLRDRTADTVQHVPEAPGSTQPTAVPPALDMATQQTVAAAAAAATLAGFDVLAPVAAPSGFTMQDGWTVRNDNSGVHVITTYRQAETDSFLTFSQSQFAEGYTVEQPYGANETVSDVMVRGQEGVGIRGRLMAHPDRDLPPTAENLLPTSWLLWEAGGITYTLYSNQLSIAELLALAETLE